MANILMEMKRALHPARKAENVTFCLGDVEWGMLAQLCDILQLPAHIMHFLGGDSYMARSGLISSVKMLERQMRVNYSDATFMYRFEVMPIDCIENGMKVGPVCENYKIVTCLGPRFKSLAHIHVERGEVIRLQLTKLVAELSNEKGISDPSRKTHKYFFTNIKVPKGKFSHIYWFIATSPSVTTIWTRCSGGMHRV